MRVRAIIIAFATMIGVTGAAVALNATEASATVWCNSNQMTSIATPTYQGNGVWRAEVICGPIMRTPRTNMGYGGNVTDVRLCSIVLGACVRTICYSYGGKYCQAYTNGGQRLQSRARLNGREYGSPTFDN